MLEKEIKHFIYLQCHFLQTFNCHRRSVEINGFILDLCLDLVENIK